MDDISTLCLTTCCMSALLLCDCMLLVYVGRTSIPLPPTPWFRSFTSFRFLHLQCMCGGDDHLAWKPLFQFGSSTSSFGLQLRVLRDQYEFKLYVDLPSWVRVEGKLVHTPVRSDMDQQSITVDQFTAVMASIQEALTSLR
ncbi:hypothetical protein AAG906_027235 [Vitis piasezkii]